MKTVNVSEILAAGGGDKFAKTEKGIDTSKKRISGGIKMSKAETLKALKTLAAQK